MQVPRTPFALFASVPEQTNKPKNKASEKQNSRYADGYRSNHIRKERGFFYAEDSLSLVESVLKECLWVSGPCRKNADADKGMSLVGIIGLRKGAWVSLVDIMQ